MSNDERAIREVIRAWMTATKEGDHATVLRLMADDVVFLVPGRPPFGKEAFAAATQVAGGASFEGTNDIEELTVAGDWAFCRCRLSVKVTPPHGDPIRRAGYTLTIFRREPSGAWVLARDANLLTSQ
ncbi:YybH family protein [Pendulispora albinea]|uniref:SgcJ/EcaC family oxidoreductase n=1 Tax=Pendulispora albinea TaxID=2741071 RepID=A0ABZ2LZI2_9BACT